MSDDSQVLIMAVGGLVPGTVVANVLADSVVLSSSATIGHMESLESFLDATESALRPDFAGVMRLYRDYIKALDRFLGLLRADLESTHDFIRRETGDEDGA